MANIIISRFSIKMPHKKNEEKIRYELELKKQDDLYKIYRYRYMSNKLIKVEIRHEIKNKVNAVDRLAEEIETLLYSI